MKKRATIIGMVALLIIAVAITAEADRRGWWGGERYNYCPNCGARLDRDDDYSGPGPGMMGRGMMGPGMMGRGWWWDDDRYGNREECTKFMNETAGLRKELLTKQFDYREALRNPNTKPEDIGKLEKEIYDLEEKIGSKSPRSCRW